MRWFNGLSWGRTLAVLVLLLAVSGGESFAVGIDDYGYERSFTLPTPNDASGGNVLFDALPNGKLLVLNGADVSVETGVKSGTFTSVGTLPSGFTSDFGPSFLVVSPDGTKAAVGSNDSGFVTVFDTANPADATKFTIHDFSGEWFDNRYLAVTNSEDNGVDILDTQTSHVTNIIKDINGFSAGVAFDAAGNLYTGNGFGFGTPGESDTGWIKAFSLSDWQAALTSNTAIDFEASGTPVADLLSADSIGFDNSGNMFVGGADFEGDSGDFGYAAFVSAAAVADALANPQATPPIDSSSFPDVLRQFPSPQSTIDNFDSPNWTYNQATGELYLNYAFGGPEVDVFVVPEPASLAILGLGALTVLTRRRRKGTPAVAAMTIAAVAAAGSGLLVHTPRAMADYTYNANDFATQVILYTGPVDSRTQYNQPSAVLGQPALTFNNSTNPNVQDDRLSKIVESPVNLDANGQPVITVLPNSPSIATLTVEMGRPVTDDPAHPYGDDLIVFGNSFYVGRNGFVDDTTNLNNDILTSTVFVHPVQVSVSPNDVDWFTFPTLSGIQPYNAYQWDAATASWTSNELNPTVPLNPAVYTENFAGKSAADVLAAYGDSAGGTALDLENALDSGGHTLAQDGYNSILYVRFASTSSDHTVIAGVSAVSDVPEPISLSLTLAGGVLLLRRPC